MLLLDKRAGLSTAHGHFAGSLLCGRILINVQSLLAFVDRPES